METMSLTADTDSDTVPADRRVLMSSVLLGLLFGGLAMLFTFFWFRLRYGSNAWAVGTDIWMMVDGARYVWDGALGYVYEGSRSYALPLGFILLAPAAGLVDHLGLIEGTPDPIPHPSAFLVVGPYEILLGILVLHAARRLAFEAGLRRHLWAVQLAAMWLVLAPSFYWGHPEDVLAVAFAMYSLRRLLRGDHLKAAFYASLAVSCKQWAAPLLVLIIFSAPVGRRIRTTLAGVLLPFVLAAFTLLVDWHDASRSLLHPVTDLVTAEGHVALFANLLGTHAAQAGRLVGLALACLLAWRLRDRSTPAEQLAAAAVILAVRPLMEPALYPYYWSPSLLLAVLAVVAVDGRCRPRAWFWVTIAGAWALPRRNPHTNFLWWVGEFILLAVSGWVVMSALGHRVTLERLRRSRPRGRVLVTA